LCGVEGCLASEAEVVEADQVEADVVEADQVEADVVEAGVVEAGAVEAGVVDLAVTSRREGLKLAQGGDRRSRAGALGKARDMAAPPRRGGMKRSANCRRISFRPSGAEAIVFVADPALRCASRWAKFGLSLRERGG